MRHVYLPGPAVSRESTSKRKAECDGKSSEGAQRENTVTVPWSREEKRAAAIDSLVSGSKIKGLTQKLMGQKGAGEIVL